MHLKHILSAVLSVCSFLTSASAQKRETRSPLCTQGNAIDTIQQQIAYTKTFDKTVQRISVLLRAADLLWLYRKDKALAAFLEAFDLATQDFKEAGDEPFKDPTAKNALPLIIQRPDQRYRVITALAKRDSIAARKLSERMLEEELAQATESMKGDVANQRTIGEKLLSVAAALISTDTNSAAMFARSSFHYPASIMLASFLFELANVNKLLSDQLYQEALKSYATAHMDQFLYLSSYPFASTRDAGEMPAYRYYRVPAGFSPNVGLQKLFLASLLRQIQSTLENPVEQVPGTRYSEAEQMWLALTRLETQIQESLPEQAEATSQAKDRLFALLNPRSQRQVTNLIADGNRPTKSFNLSVEAAEKLADPAQRDQALTFAVLHATLADSNEHVIGVIEKIADAEVRESLFKWFFLFRTQALITAKRFDEARSVAARVTDLDGKAYLYSRIAEETLKRGDDQIEAREMLDEIANSAARAPKTVVTARALLALANLYARIDVNRGIEELGHAVKLINSLDAPDFSSESVMMKIEGKTFSSFGAFSTPGFNPENAFRQMAKFDFDGSLYQAGTFTDKTLRSLTTLAVIESCLSQPIKRTLLNTKSARVPT